VKGRRREMKSKLSSEETVVTYFFSRIATVTSSTNDGDPSPPSTFHYNGRANYTFSSPDAFGVINLTIPKESTYSPPEYDPIMNITRQFTVTSDPYGKLYTLNGTGDVDIISMTNDTGTFFWKDGSWHPPREEWLGDGTPDPPGSSWVYFTYNVSLYVGNGTDGLFLGMRSIETWRTTGYSENTIIEPASRLNGSYMNATGVPFSDPFVGSIHIFVDTSAKLNDPLIFGTVDSQHKVSGGEVETGAFVSTLLSPANFYVTDPENKHIGTDPITGGDVNEVPGAFYSGPGTYPQRIVISNPVDGIYGIKIVGTGTGEYTSIFELGTLETITTYDYTGNISDGQILESQANISGNEMTSTEPLLTSPVGGISIPVEKLALLAPYIGLTILLAVAVVTVVYVKKRKRNTEIFS
jgi:hypothetical protein